MSKTKITLDDAYKGDGIKRIVARIFTGDDPEKDEKKKIKLAKSRRVPELDFIARVLPENELDSLSEELINRLSDDSQAPSDIAEFILAEKRALEIRKREGTLIS